MPAIVPVLIGASAGLDVLSAAAQKRAADNAAAVDQATAAYNANYDTALAQQLDKDTQANITTERQNNAAYLSKQEASYASAGVLANTGSALDAQITNAGRMEQQIQQQWVNAQQKEASYYAAGNIGILEGQAQADADRVQGSIALLNGGAKIASLAMQGYNEGVFGTPGGGDSGNPNYMTGYGNNP